MEALTEIEESLREGDHARARAAVRRAVESGLGPAAVLHGALLPGMAAVGEGFRQGDLFLPEVLMAARAMKAAMEILDPLLEAGGTRSRGRVVLGTVRGDIHDLGKNLVAVMMRGAGWEVVDLGTDVPAARFAEVAEETGARAVGASALLTTTMPRLAEIVAAVRERCGGRVATMVGGAPVTAAYAREIGAGGWAPDAPSAVEALAALVPAGVPCPSPGWG